MMIMMITIRYDDDNYNGDDNNNRRFCSNFDDFYADNYDDNHCNI